MALASSSGHPSGLSVRAVHSLLIRPGFLVLTAVSPVFLDMLADVLPADIAEKVIAR